jgi:hypothetical protein
VRPALAVEEGQHRPRDIGVEEVTVIRSGVLTGESIPAFSLRFAAA